MPVRGDQVSAGISGHGGEFVFPAHASLLTLFRFVQIHRRGQFPGGDGVEILPHHCQGLAGLEIADDGEHRVVGFIVSFVEFFHVLEAGVIQILHRTDHGVLVGPVLVSLLIHQLVKNRRVRSVVHPHSPLLLYSVALVLEILFRHRQGAHPVRLQPQRQAQLVGGNHFEVIGAILPGGAVHPAAHVAHQGHVFGFSHVLGALEHHVLEQVRKAALARRFVPGADVVPHVHRGDRRSCGFHQHDG